MIVQDLINEIEKESKQEKARQQESKTRQEEFKQMFYKTLYDLEQANLNLSLVVGDIKTSTFKY